MESIGITTNITADCTECCPRQSSCHLCCWHAEASEEERRVQDIAVKTDVVKPKNDGKCVIL